MRSNERGDKAVYFSLTQKLFVSYDSNLSPWISLYRLKKLTDAWKTVLILRIVLTNCDEIGHELSTGE